LHAELIDNRAMPQPTCCRVDYDALFDDRDAQRQLDDYRRNGPARHTQRLLDALVAEGVSGASLLDIGGGIGAVQHELLAAGAASSVDVDFSRPYLAAAGLEAERRGLADREVHRYGNFVDLAEDVEAADIVTLDRVICCYPDMAALVASSADHARRLYGLVFPVDRWWIRAGAATVNVVLRITRQTYRIHVHRTAAVDALVRSHGFERRSRERGLIWQSLVYRRAGA
jgi:2-polyprenyl-3-methyl-5-hydroxy-6-metoxy-1,4-benzoquinol methylase